MKNEVRGKEKVTKRNQIRDTLELIFLTR